MRVAEEAPGLVWLRLAKDDLDWGHDSLARGDHPQTCCVAQQVGEKALKALAPHRGHEVVRGNSIVSLAEKLGINEEILAAGRRLDLYYIAPRYPDALPDSGDPRAHFDEAMAGEALELAQCILSRIEKEMHGHA